MKNGNGLSGKNIVLGVCGSIAAYKACDIASLLVRNGANVKVVMTESAQKIIAPKALETVSRNKVCSDMWAECNSWVPEHISLADFADLLVVAPATANTIGNFANGLAPDMLSSLYLATTAPVLIAPAMNTKMLLHPAVVKNMEILKERGAEFVEAGDGVLACGAVGKGRLADPAEIAAKAAEILS